MGGQNSCLSRAPPETVDNTLNIEKQLGKDMHEAGKADEVEVVQEIEVNIEANPLPIQSALRGHFARKEIQKKRENIKKPSVFNPEEHFEVVSQDLEELEASGIKEVEGNLPDLQIVAPADDDTKVLMKPAVKLTDGSVYKGSWDEKGNMHGVGTLLTEDGAKIVGYFKGNKLEGKGRSIESTGLVYQGDFKDGKFEGEGQFFRKNGANFTGGLKDGKLNGDGSEEWPDGTKYVGGYLDGERHGNGKLTLKDGGSYEGQFRNNLIHGKGRYVWANKNEYKGKWRKNQMHGRGIFKWPDGRIYDGEWKNDLRDGQGEMSWPDGKKYVGEWKNGKQHGNGAYSFKNKEGKVVERNGVWEDGIKADDLE